jgi:hypothetical protein
LTQKNLNSGEIIDQDVIKALSLIFFVQKNLPLDLDPKQLDEVENKFLSICDPKSKNEIISEAHNLCDMYMDLVSEAKLS